jgi:hypothetical protein
VLPRFCSERPCRGGLKKRNRLTPSDCLPKGQGQGDCQPTAGAALSALPVSLLGQKQIWLLQFEMSAIRPKATQRDAFQ